MDGVSISTAAEAAGLLAARFGRSDAEKIAILYLDGERRLLRLSEYSGSTDSADLPLRAIVAEALRLEAAGMVVAHNHPSGEARPSEEDVAATAVLARALRDLEIRLYDHLIFAGDDCASFRALGLL
jgi:DNA repair protein RadC